MPGWLQRFTGRRDVGRAAPVRLPRMPADRVEAERVFRRYDANNGCYYLIADVRLSDGRLLEDVVFDADTLVAVEYARRRIFEQSEWFGQPVTAWLVNKDHSLAYRYGEATEAERCRFRTMSPAMIQFPEPSPGPSFEEVVREHEREIYRLILRQVEDPEVAEDLTQETFLTAYRGFSSRDPAVGTRRWLCGIALAQTKSYLRSQWDREKPDPASE